MYFRLKSETRSKALVAFMPESPAKTKIRTGGEEE